MNEEIKSPYVRVVGQDKKMIGVMPIKEALRLARMQGMDLVEVAPKADPPVCKIMDYGRFLYEEKVKRQEAKRRQHQVETHQIRLSLNITEHDYNVKLKKIKEFLEDKDRVKVVVMLRGREVLHKERGIELIEKLQKDLEGIGVLESSPRIEGEARMSIQAVFLPVKGG